MSRGMLTIKQKGSWKKTHELLQTYIQNDHYISVLEKYGQKGVEALSAATPVGSGKTAESWDYEIKQNYKNGYYSIVWTNSNVVDSPRASHPVNVAIILQYGHGTRNGGYVQGIDYINPALEPVFQEMLDKVWEEIGHK